LEAEGDGAGASSMGSLRMATAQRRFSAGESAVASASINALRAVRRAWVRRAE
jgi:hypothetical protein